MKTVVADRLLLQIMVFSPLLIIISKLRAGPNPVVSIAQCKVMHTIPLCGQERDKTIVPGWTEPWIPLMYCNKQEKWWGDRQTNRELCERSCVYENVHSSNVNNNNVVAYSGVRLDFGLSPREASAPVLVTPVLTIQMTGLIILVFTQFWYLLDNKLC